MTPIEHLTENLVNRGRERQPGHLKRALLMLKRKSQLRKSEHQLQKVKQYNKIGQAGLAKLHEEWKGILQRASEAGIDIEQLYIEPEVTSRTAEGEPYKWRWLGMPV